MTGANSIGNNRINKMAVNKGLPKITAILALTVMATHITGIIGKNCAIAAPTATLAKIEGKIFPPRQPKLKPILVDKVLMTAITSKNNGDIYNAWCTNGTI